MVLRTGGLCELGIPVAWVWSVILNVYLIRLDSYGAGATGKYWSLSGGFYVVGGMPLKGALTLQPFFCSSFLLPDYEVRRFSVTCPYFAGPQGHPVMYFELGAMPYKVFLLWDHHLGYRGLGRNTSFVDGTDIVLTSRLNPETVSDGKATSCVWLLLYLAVPFASSSSGCNVGTSGSWQMLSQCPLSFLATRIVSQISPFSLYSI